ncbi:MAG: helix-turn-helix transcriptional regulator [Prolixibacteraceae bacterium]|jgi:AraC-like DNA-binding protein
MKHLNKGQFYGEVNEITKLEGVILTDTEYTHRKVDWHYHETPYFTFILQGGLIEENKKEIYQCSTGDLLFHNWQEAHYNIKPEGFARGFHIELDQNWIDSFSLDMKKLQGSICITNPAIKLLLYQIFRETKINDNTTGLSIQNLLLSTFVQMEGSEEINYKERPRWVYEIQEILHEYCCESLSLTGLSNLLNLHPAHISRYFPKYFRCSLGEYLRKLKVERSLSLMSNKKLSLTQIAFECGFSDQSHFIRCFREITGTNPSVYRKLLLG